MSLTRRVQRRILRAFAWAERPAAWVLMVGGFLTFVAVLLNLVATGSAKWATLLVAADLTVSGFSAVQEVEDDDEEIRSPADYFPTLRVPPGGVTVAGPLAEPLLLIPDETARAGIGFVPDPRFSTGDEWERTASAGVLKGTSPWREVAKPMPRQDMAATVKAVQEAPLPKRKSNP